MLNAKETIELYSYEILLESGNVIEADHITPLLNSLYPGDKICISVIIDGTQPYQYYPKKIEDIDMILQLNEHIDDDSETIIKVEIIKPKEDSINIYNLNHFIEYLNNLNLFQLLTIFKTYSDSDTKILINHKEMSNSFISTNLFTTNKHDTIKVISSSLGRERIEAWNFSSNTQNIGSFGFIPDDFRVYKKSDNFEYLSDIFNKLALILSISYISDMSKIEGNIFNFKIMGYKKVDVTFDASATSLSEIFYKIYTWVYESGNGNIDDKIGLARNIISRYIKTNPGTTKISLEEDAYSSLLTSHKMYLKENVEKYIDTKNKVAEIVTEQSVKTSDSINFISNSFKNNNLTLLSYFISLFIFSALSEKKQQIFTKEIFLISITFLIISGIYLYITYKQFNKDIKRNVRYFFSIKKIYKDLFDPKELNDIFNLRQLRYDAKLIKSTAKNYFIFWILEIIILLILTSILTFHVEILMLINFFEYIPNFKSLLEKLVGIGLLIYRFFF